MQKILTRVTGAVATLALGLRSDPTFGPVLFVGSANRSDGAGPGDRTFALPPLNGVLARHLLEHAPASPPASAQGALDVTASALVRLSQLVIDQGALVELELDPLFVLPGRVVAGGARARLAPGLPRGEERLAIRPYPRELESAIELHALNATLGAVEQRFRDVGHLSKERATEEAERVAVDPGAGSAALGRLLLRELEKEYLRLRPLSTPSEMEAAFLAEGQVPIRLLRLKLLGLNPS